MKSCSTSRWGSPTKRSRSGAAISIRSVQGRLQQLYAKLGLLDQPTLDGHTAVYNSRTRAISLALTMRLINARSIETAAEDHQRTLSK